MASTELEPLAPERVFHDRYRIVRCIEKGGMGAVYEVLDSRTSRRRALKTMLPSIATDPDLRARFELEARVTADIETEHIVETFDAGIDTETATPFLVMELLRGESLEKTLETRGSLPPAEVVLLLGQAAHALDLTHEAGIVHRDLKPANLFLTRRDDRSPRLKILDFGIAKLVAQSTQSIKTTRSVGTPVYMSPEQVRGDGTIDHRADLYSLGHIAYALLTGEPYWETEGRDGQLYSLLMKIAAGAKEPPSSRAAKRGVTLPEAFDAWFVRATAPDPGDRFDAASEMIAGLGTALGVDTSSPTSLNRIVLDTAPLSKRALGPDAVAASTLSSGAPDGGGTHPSVVAPTRPQPAPATNWLMVGSVAALGVAVIAIGIGVAAKSVSGRDPSVGAVPAAAGSALTPLGAPPAERAAASAGAPAVSASTASTSEPTPAAPSPAKPAPSATTAARGPARPTASTRPVLARGSVPAAATVNCDPWYTLDSSGRQIPKPGCN